MAEDWQRVADYVIARRQALGYRTRVQFAATFGGRPTLRTLAKLESGQPVSVNTAAKVQDKLGWGPGSIGLVMGGREPILLEGGTGAGGDEAYVKAAELAPHEWTVVAAVVRSLLAARPASPADMADTA